MELEDLANHTALIKIKKMYFKSNYKKILYYHHHHYLLFNNIIIYYNEI